MPERSSERPASPRHVRVTSAKNPIVREVRDAAVGKTAGLMVAEGRQLVWDALETDLAMPIAAVSPHVLNARDGHDLRRRLEQRADLFADCTETVFEKMSSLTTPPGVLAVLQRPERTLADLAPAGTPSPLVVVVAGLRDPGNLGAVVRSAEAMGADGLCVLRGSADPFREKALRGSMGSALRLPIAVGPVDGPVGIEPAELLAFVESRGMRLVVLDSSSDAEPLGAGVDLTGPLALVVGAEASGVPEEIRKAATQRVRIPMQPAVDSLNAGVAAGVVLYEAARQRSGA
jgi:TrmH family RNA methyltransferase